MFTHRTRVRNYGVSFKILSRQNGAVSLSIYTIVPVVYLAVLIMIKNVQL